MTLQIALRNFTRNGRRFLLLGVAVSAGFFFVCIVQSLVAGLSHQINLRGARYYGGNVIVSIGKDVQDGAARTLEDRAILEAVSRSGVVPAALSHRTHLGGQGVAFFNGESVDMRRVIGMDWAAEGRMISRLQFVEGNPAGMSDPRGVLISEVTARRLGARTGDQIILQVNRDAGSINTVSLWVKAVFREASIFGFYTMYMDRAVLNQSLGFDPGHFASIGIYLDDYRMAGSAAARITRALGGRESADPLIEYMREIGTLLRALSSVSYGILALLSVVIAVGIFNLYRVIIYERTREIGTMRAIGLQRIQVRNLVLCEAAMLAVSGIAAGLALSVLGLAGISLIPLTGAAGLDIFLDRGHLSWVMNADTIVVDALLITFVTLAGALYPAQAAQKIEPVVALRADEKADRRIVKAWMASGLRTVSSRRFLTVLLVVIAINLVYRLAVAFNPLLVYLSCAGLMLYVVSLFLMERDEWAPARHEPSQRRTHRVLGVVLLCSLALRGIGATWGFPIFGHPDEYVVTDPAIAMTVHGSIDPGYYNRPNHISIYCSAILYPVVSRIVSRGDVLHTFADDKKPFYLASRLVTAGWGVLMTAAAFLIGSMAAPAAGIIAAALFALFPPFIENSHYITPDIPLTALLMFVLLYCLRYMREGRTRDLFLALVFSCLAFAEKYPAFLALPLLLLVVVCRTRNGSAAVFATRGEAPLRDRKAVILIFFIAVAVCAAGAYAWRHPDLSPAFKAYVSSALHKPIPPDFTPRVRTLSRLLVAGGVLLGALAVFLRFLRGGKYGAAIFILLGMPVITFIVTPFLFLNFSGVFSAISGESTNTHLGADNLGYVGNLLFYAGGYIDAAGIVSLVFMAIGTGLVFRQRALLPLLFSFFYWICLSALSLHFERWALPMYAGPLLLVSLGLYGSFRFLSRKAGRPAAVAVLGALCAIPCVAMLVSSAATTRQFVLEDTRAVSQRWCAAHGVTEQNAAFDGYSPFDTSGAGTVDYPGSGAKQYVVVSSSMYNRFLRDRVRHRREADMYTRIFALPLMSSFSPVEAGVSRFFEISTIPVQVNFLMRMGGRDGPAYRGPTIQIFRAMPGYG